MNDILFSPEPIIRVQRFFGLGHQSPFEAIDLLATNWGAAFAVAFTLWMWGRRDAYALVAIVALEAATNLVMNELFHVPRPSAPGIVKYDPIQLSSFPSGHVYTVTVLWGLLWARGRVPFVVPAAIVISVAVGRLYLGAHYLIDVVAGALFGVALIWVFLRIWPKLEPWLEGRPFRFFVGLAAAGVAGGVLFATVLAEPSTFLWNSAGLMIGGSTALALEHRYVRYRPVENGLSGVEKVCIGLVGLVPPLTIDLVTEGALRVGAAMIAGGALWALLGVPWLLARLESRRTAVAGTARRRLSSGGTIGWSLAALAGLMILYGTLIEPRLILDEERETVELAGLPPEWEGRRLAVLADLQLGMWGGNPGMARRAARAAVAAEPAAVLLLGDFIYHPPAEPRDLTARVTEVLGPLLEAGIPVYAVLGNHDWGLDVRDGTINPVAAGMVADALESRGVRVLQNEAEPLRATGGQEPLYVVGIGSEWAGTALVGEAFAEVPPDAPRLVVMHNPTSFARIPAHAAPFAIAAHTHGGQLRIPMTRSWSWLAIVRQGEPHADGWSEDGYGAPGNRVYVNRGIGFSDVPIRLNCPPELTVFTLRRK